MLEDDVLGGGRATVPGGGRGMSDLFAAVDVARLREVPCEDWAHGRERSRRARALSRREEETATAGRDTALPFGRCASNEAEVVEREESLYVCEDIVAECDERMRRKELGKGGGNLPIYTTCRDRVTRLWRAKTRSWVVMLLHRVKNLAWNSELESNRPRTAI